MSDIIIREVYTEDSERVCVISSEDLGYPCEVSLVRRKIGSLDHAREEVFVAEVDGVVAGYIHIERFEVLYFESMANVLGLAVDSSYRRMGIGKALISKAEKWCLDNGIGVIRLNSGSTRTGAHKFYAGLGYDNDKEQKRFIKRL